MSDFKIGDVLTRNQVDEHLVKGTKVYDQSTGQLRVRSHGDGYVFTDHGPTPAESTYVLVELPADLTDREIVAQKLHDANPGAVVDWPQRGERVQDNYRGMAGWILENFVPRGKVNTPDMVKDGTGDWWYLAENGYYFYNFRNGVPPTRANSDANMTLDEISRAYNGLVERVY